MAHYRAVIRRRIETVLAGAISGITVQASRVRPWQRAELPGVAVRTPREAVTLDDKLDIERRDLVVVISIADRAGEASDDILDDLCLDIEGAIEADWQDETAGALGALLIDWQLESTETEQVDESDHQVGGAEITYRASYLAVAGAPSA